MIVLFRLDRSAYILCLLNSIARLASSMDEAWALNSGIAVRARAVELICRRLIPASFVEQEAKEIGIGRRGIVRVHDGHPYGQHPSMGGHTCRS